MTQKPEAEPEANPPESVLPERISDVTPGPTQKIQPVLVGFVLAAIIGLITVLAFWGR
jgi:hypothetical protein